MGDGDEVTRIEVFGAGTGPLFVCEHASNAILAPLGDLGLDEAARQSHIAWDPGALPLARALARRFEGRLIHCSVSRLVYDCNRPPEATDAIPARTEVYDIPGNQHLDASARQSRIDAVYGPWVAALTRTLDRVRPPAMVTVHSFTPVYFGKPRETRIGILHDFDSRFADAMLHAASICGVTAHRNRPYGPEDGVTHTLAAFAAPRDLPTAMIEVRNDLLIDAVAVEAMAATLGDLIGAAMVTALQSEGQA